MKKQLELKEIISMVKMANLTEAIWYLDKARKLVKKHKLDKIPNRTVPYKNGMPTKGYLMKTQINMIIFEAKKRIIELTNNDENILSLI